MVAKLPPGAASKAAGFIVKRIGRLWRDAKGRLRDNLGRFAKDPWKAARQALPKASELIKKGKEYKGTGTGKHKNAFPNKADPDEVLFRRDPATGDVQYYATYDNNGDIVKRVDLNPASAVHDGVPPPHTVYYYRDRAPDGKIYVRADKQAYPATTEEIP